MKEQEHIPSLDGWRAISIALVVMSHGLWNTSRIAEKMGALGVNIFFAISGYLICTLLLREREKYGTISLRKFYIRRFFRIIPPAVSYLLVIGAGAALGWIPVRQHELATALLLANYFPDRLWYTAHYWSLCVEEHFYMVWPGLLAALGTSRAAVVGLALAAACVIYRPWEAAHVSGAFRYQRTEMRIDAFVLPCVLAILLRNTRWKHFFARVLTPAVLVLLMFFVVAGSYLAELHPQYNSLNKLLQASILPLFVVGPVLNPQTVLARILNWNVLQMLGRISYAVYIWQQLFLFDTSSTAGRRLLIPLAIAAIVLVAWASDRYLEGPLRRFGRRLAQ